MSAARKAKLAASEKEIRATINLLRGALEYAQNGDLDTARWHLREAGHGCTAAREALLGLSTTKEAA